VIQRKRENERMRERERERIISVTGTIIWIRVWDKVWETQTPFQRLRVYNTKIRLFSILEIHSKFGALLWGPRDVIEINERKDFEH
jgi:hypothetical protein